MSPVQRIDDQLTNLDYPPLITISSLAIRDKDILIIAAGFENRSIGILTKALEEAASFTVLIVEFLPFDSRNRITEILQICNASRIKIIRVTYNRENPTRVGEYVLELTASCTGQIYVDISAMPRLLIVQMIVALGQSNRGFLDTSLLYCEAEIYHPNQNTFTLPSTEALDSFTLYRDTFMSSGVYEVIIVPELTSIAAQGQPSRLIAMPSFNADQLTSLVAELQPSYYSIIHGLSPHNEYSWRTQAIRSLNSIDNIDTRYKEEFSISTLDYRDTMMCLLAIYRKHELLQRLIIAPTGSKMQAVAVGIFRTFMNDVQIAYPTPSVFSPEYTEGIRFMYRLDLNFLQDYVG